MSQDPWEVDDNPLDLNDSMDDRVRMPIAFTRANADWLTEAGHALFAQGTPVSVSQAQEEAYAALAMPDRLSSPFGLDSAQPAPNAVRCSCTAAQTGQRL